MNENEQEDLEPQEPRQDDAGEVLREDQEHKGFGEDEGERDESLPK